MYPGRFTWIYCIILLGVWTADHVLATLEASTQVVKKIEVGRNLTENRAKIKAATIEFKAIKGKNLTNEEYIAIRQAILNYLNKRREQQNNGQPPTPVSIVEGSNNITGSIDEGSNNITESIDEGLPPTPTGPCEDSPACIRKDQPPSGNTNKEDSPPPGRRRRNIEPSSSDRPSDAGVYTEADLDFILVEPEEKGGVFRVTLIGTGEGKSEINQTMLLEAIEEVRKNGELKIAAGGLEVHDYYGGMPRDTELDPLWIWLPILIVVLLLLLLLLLFCILCRRRRWSKNLPITDSTDVEGEVKASPTFCPAPPNGLPPSTLQKTDSSGWIVPLSQLSDDEMPMIQPIRL